MGLDDFELEPSAAEPDEWDPEADQHDPDADGLTIPSVSTAESEAPADVRKTFWIVTLIVNVAILFVSVGPMIIYFEGWTRNGLVLIAAGLVLFGLAYRRYRSFMADGPDDSGDGPPNGGGGPVDDRPQSDADSDRAAETLSDADGEAASPHTTETS